MKMLAQKRRDVTNAQNILETAKVNIKTSTRNLLRQLYDEVIRSTQQRY